MLIEHDKVEKSPQAGPPAAVYPFTILLAAAGRRVALLNLIRQSCEQLGIEACMLVTDITMNSAAMHCGDIARTLPPYNHPDCLEHMLRLCKEFRVRLIVPTIDPDLSFLAVHRQQFEDIGVKVMLCSAETIEICNDKVIAHDWLVKNGFPVLRQINAGRLFDGDRNWPFPLFVKPRFGSSSVGARVVNTIDEMRHAVANGEYIAQDVARGCEYTVDVYIDRAGKCRCAVPRLRIETRGGEVTKAITARVQPILDLVRRVAETLPGAEGVLNIQVFYDVTSTGLVVSEINPRFGGGYPLTHAAGAPMARWMIQEAIGELIPADDTQWTDQMMMLRYDEAVFAADAQLEAFDTAYRPASDIIAQSH